jgi:hypothetical protein
MKDVAALVAELKELITLLAAPFLKLEAGYKSEKLAQLQLVPDAGQHVHEALAFAFLLHNPEAAIKSMNKDAVGIDVSKLPSWQVPDSGGQLVSINVDYSKLTARQLADIKAKRKMGTVLVTLTNAPSWKEEGAFREQLGGTYGNDELGVVFINLDAEKTAEYKKEAAFTRAMALAKNPAYKAMFPTGPNTLWFVRPNIRLHPEDYRDFLWRSGHVPLSELTEILDSGYEQAAHATGEWIKSWDREAPREAPLLIQLIADLNPIMGIAKFISLVKDDKPLYAMPGTKATTIDWVEGWVGLAAAGEAIFGDLIAVSFKSAKALKVVKVGRWAANFTGKLSEELLQKWAKECIKDERVKKLIADIITVGLDKGIWDGFIRNVDKAIDESKGVKTEVKPTVQRKLQVNTAGDAYEQEADRTAEQVLRMSEPQPQRTCAPYGYLGYQTAQATHEDLQTKRVESDHTGEVAVPPIVHEVIHSSGQPLDSTTRDFMEPRFGRDFGGVRLHTGAKAAQSARAVDALAYTVGQAVVFGSDQYKPNTQTGRRLLAHELTHTLQQGTTGVPMVARNGSEQYGTKVVPFTGGTVKSAVERSYWEDKVGSIYGLVYEAAVSGRFTADGEERDAVLSSLWGARPMTLTAPTVKLVKIPARGVANSKALLYRFTFTPKTAGATKDRVQIEFEAEGAATTTTTAPALAVGVPPKLPSVITVSNFPDGNKSEDYWTAHPEERRRLYNWVEQLAPNSFDQIITTEVASAAADKPAMQTATFRVAGQKSGGAITKLTIRFLGALPITKAVVPAGYHDKDGLDLIIEELQSKPDTMKDDKLGAILPKNLAAFPADERAPVKYVIWQYFTAAHSRNMEVDAIVPIMTTEKRVFYTLNFKANNDVEVKRIAEEGTGKGQMSLGEMNIARVRGYMENIGTPPALTAWLKKRYPSITPKGTTVADLQKNANTSMQADVGKPAWFATNYTLNVLPSSAGKTRLIDKHGLTEDLATDVIDFQPSDLNFIEFALQTMREAILALLAGVSLVRKKAGFFRKKDEPYTPDSKVAGLALQSSSGDKTIALFDLALVGDQSLFSGGGGGIRQEATMTAAHEFGHIIEKQAGIREAFLNYVGKNKLEPVSWYSAESAQSKEKSEVFTEAFAVYSTDPEWMKNKRPLLYYWFEELNKTGKPPPL